MGTAILYFSDGKTIPQPMAVIQEHIDGAATWRMFLKRRWRRLRSRLSHFCGHMPTLVNGFDFRHGASC